MLVALTGTPGVGKSAVSQMLKVKGYTVVDINAVVSEYHLYSSIDAKRNSKIIDFKKLNAHIEETYAQQDLVILDSHVSHLINGVDKVIILRCHPTNLQQRLSTRQWNMEKIKENVEAEVLDVILCEAVEHHAKSNIFEIDTTHLPT
ncbi:MAG: adenylate kinase family protein, partial [Candidatus Thermoplasmatota archaeon]|nr:adenylate kinase family protein [Candidatus Thermoplasmatota archaeon]